MTRANAYLYSEPMADYLARPEMSGGKIELFSRSRRDYVRQVVHGRPGPDPSDEMRLGSMVHASVVPGPHDPDIGSIYCCAPRRHDLDETLFGTPEGARQVDRRTKAGKAAWAEFLTQSEGKVVIPPALWDRVPRMLRALRAHSEAAELLWDSDGMNEQTCVFREPETARLCKVRFDRLLSTRPVVVELKTAHAIGGDRVAWEWYRLGYHRKAALYIDAFSALYGRNATFAYVFVESSDDPDPQVAVWPLETDSPAVAIGRDEYQQQIREIQRCEREQDYREPWERGETAYPLPGPVLSRAEFLGGVDDEPITMGGQPLGGL